MPLPVPLAPFVIDTHEASSVAVQVQPAGIETAMLPVADAGSTATPVGDSVAAHGMPACVSVKAWPAIVTTPVRGEIVVFAATL